MLCALLEAAALKRDTVTLSIIIPTLNEAERLPRLLASLSPLRTRGTEVIVVDGGSGDESLSRAQRGADCVMSAPRGRARQMNAGAAAAHGTILLFLHADMDLPVDADHLIAHGVERSDRCWGRFDVRIEGRPWMLRVIATSMNWRSRLTGIATGDQGIFVTRDAFQRVGGFRDQPLMEDIALSAALRRLSRPVCLSGPAVTSGRRWESRGVWRTIFLMWRLRWQYWRGVSPERLAASYR